MRLFQSSLNVLCKHINSYCALILMTEQNRNCIKKEIGKLLSEIWRIKGLSEQEYGSNHLITKKLSIMHEQVQELLKEK
jgi:hypothetical protein